MKYNGMRKSRKALARGVENAIRKSVGKPVRKGPVLDIDMLNGNVDIQGCLDEAARYVETKYSVIGELRENCGGIWQNEDTSKPVLCSYAYSIAKDEMELNYVLYSEYHKGYGKAYLQLVLSGLKRTHPNITPRVITMGWGDWPQFKELSTASDTQEYVLIGNGPIITKTVIDRLCDVMVTSEYREKAEEECMEAFAAAFSELADADLETYCDGLSDWVCNLEDSVYPDRIEEMYCYDIYPSDLDDVEGAIGKIVGKNIETNPTGIQTLNFVRTSGGWNVKIIVIINEHKYDEEINPYGLEIFVDIFRDVTPDNYKDFGIKIN